MAAHCLRGMKWKNPGNMSGDCEEQVNGSQSLIVLPAKKKTLNKKKVTCHTISMSYHFMSYYITEYHLINTYQFL